MKCETEYCVYNKNFQCHLKCIEINSIGMCVECMIVSLDKNFLDGEKERQLGELRKQEARWEDCARNKKDPP